MSGPASTAVPPREPNEQRDTGLAAGGACRSLLLDTISGQRRGIAAGALRCLLAGLSFVYVAGLKLYLLPYRLGIRKRARLSCRVISIGNLTVGGTGKTSVVQRVAEFLAARGVAVCVLSRGYHGAAEQGVAVVSTTDRVELSAQAVGDEPYLLARTLPGVPVVVGRDRRRTGAAACRRFSPAAVLLDDGMQYYQLHRDLDVVLVDAVRPFDNGWAFPRGLLREPPSHLRRAACVVLTNADKVDASELGRLRNRVTRLAPRAQVFTSRYESVTLRSLDRSGDREVQWLAGRKVATFCALGNPVAFEDQVARLGATIVHRTRMPDHHEPKMVELADAVAGAVASAAEATIVTEKDAVKLPPVGRPMPFYALVARQRFDDEGAFFAVIMRALDG